MEASPVAASSWPMRRRIALGLALFLTAASLLTSVAAVEALDLRPAPHEYDVGAWEVRNLPSKWLYAIGELFRADRSREQEDADLGRFFELTRLIESTGARLTETLDEGTLATTESELARLRQERTSLENRVEATLEARLSAVFEEAGITRSLPLLGDFVWPPVDMEFTDPPRTLAVSARERIELLDTTLLRADLSLDEIEAIEAETEERRNVSALAFPTSGIGAYPTIVAFPSSYGAALELAAHEYMHNYLFFSPLGFRYYEGNDLRAMNETVADLVAREVAGLVQERWPLQGPETERPRQPEPGIDTGAVLRELRLQVDELLARGLIDEAEQLMEQRRQELAAQGVRFRKLNQAYFAFTNLYAGEAGNPASTNPIGPKIDELRRLSPSLGAFVKAIGGVTSVEELDRVLEEARSQR